MSQEKPHVASEAEERVLWSCPVCDSCDVRTWYPSGLHDVEEVSFSYTFSPRHNRTFQVLRCRVCTHAFCCPIPGNIARRYCDVIDEEYLLHATSRTLSAEAVLGTLRTPHLGERLLDVGCATGDLLAAAKRMGFEPEGLELSEWSARLARERGFTVYEEYLETLAQRAPDTYDVITLMGVIEHFSSPRSELNHVRRLLKPGGVLAIWTGDVDSILSRILGRKWWYWQGQHIQYFTHRSLVKLLHDTGFTVVARRVFPFGATIETISNSLRRYRFHKMLSRLVWPFFALKPVWLLRLPGEMLIFAESPHLGHQASLSKPA